MKTIHEKYKEDAELIQESSTARIGNKDVVASIRQTRSFLYAGYVNSIKQMISYLKIQIEVYGDTEEYRLSDEKHLEYLETQLELFNKENI